MRILRIVGKLKLFLHPSFHSVELPSRLLLDWSPISLRSSWNVCDCCGLEEMATNNCDESEAAGNGDTVKQSHLFQSHMNFQFWEFTAGSLFYSWSWRSNRLALLPILLSSSSIPVIPHQHFPILYFLAGSHSRDSSLLLPCRGPHSSKQQVSKTKLV